jgi:methyl coenzyme M reductase subunit C
MTVGYPTKTGNLIVETFTVKTNEDIELGEIVVNDGNGILAATSSTKGPYFGALEAHDYSEVSEHDIPCVVVGEMDVQAVPAAATVKGRWVEMSTTSGAITIFDYSSPGDWFDVVGIAMEVAATTATDCKVLLGHLA